MYFLSTTLALTICSPVLPSVFVCLGKVQVEGHSFLFLVALLAVVDGSSCHPGVQMRWNKWSRIFGQKFKTHAGTFWHWRLFWPHAQRSTSSQIFRLDLHRKKIGTGDERFITFNSSVKHFCANSCPKARSKNQQGRGFPLSRKTKQKKQKKQKN